MIAHYRLTPAGATPLPGFVLGGWVRVEDPEPSDVQGLGHAYGVPQEYLTRALDPDERPHVERGDEVDILVLQASAPLGGASRLPFDTVPVGVVLAPDFVITVCGQTLGLLDDLAAAARFPGRWAGQSDGPRRFALALVTRAAGRYLADLRTIDAEVTRLEGLLRFDPRNPEILSLLQLQKSLVYFQTALQANTLMLRRWRLAAQGSWNDEDLDLLDDVMIEMAQGLEMTGLTLGTLTSTLETFSSVVSNNTSVTARRLTVLTVLVAVPTFLTSLFGMNVALPFQHAPWVFDVLMVVLVLVEVGLLGSFRRIGWM